MNANFVGFSGRRANVIVAASYGLLPTSPIQLRTMLPQEDLAGPLRPLVVQTNPIIWKFVGNLAAKMSL